MTRFGEYTKAAQASAANTLAQRTDFAAIARYPDITETVFGTLLE
jgi:hypothetical protein